MHGADPKSREQIIVQRSTAHADCFMENWREGKQFSTDTIRLSETILVFQGFGTSAGPIYPWL